MSGQAAVRLDQRAWGVSSTPGPAVGASRASADWRRASPRAFLLIAGLTALLVVVAYDRSRDGLVNWFDAASDVTPSLRWLPALLVVVLGAAHYGAAALAARAAGGVDTPLGETVLVQLSAATANRITPAGLGGATVIARYLTKRGRLPIASAVGAVAALTALGAVADIAIFAAITAVGSLVGLPGGPAVFGQLVRRLDTAMRGLTVTSWWWGALGVVAAVGALTVVRRRRRSAGPPVRQRFLLPMRLLLHRPGALITLLLASGTTTVMLGLAFAASAAAVPGPHPQATVGALVVGYMLAVGLTGVLPLPSSVGTAEAALVGVLVSVHQPAAHAVVVVLFFRIVTYWLPAVAGLGAARHLRHCGAL